MVVLPAILAGCSTAAICLQPPSSISTNTTPGISVPAGCKLVSSGVAQLAQFECDNGRTGFAFISG
jgi:hypothetical protein